MCLPWGQSAYFGSFELPLFKLDLVYRFVHLAFPACKERSLIVSMIRMNFLDRIFGVKIMIAVIGRNNYIRKWL